MQAMCQASMMSPRVGDVDRQPLRKTKEYRFSSQLPGACILSVARDIRGNGHLFQSKNRNTITANSFAN
jgi:hypothetical protein